ncbi:hypothetical protein [Streptomyces sp. NPDC055085]
MATERGAPRCHAGVVPAGAPLAPVPAAVLASGPHSPTEKLGQASLVGSALGPPAYARRLDTLGIWLGLLTGLAATATLLIRRFGTALTDRWPVAAATA